MVTCFLENREKVLILKRSSRVGSYQQRWAGISGFIEAGVSPLEQALIELREEVGLNANDLKLKNEGDVLEIIDSELDKKWLVHPFKFGLEDHNQIKLDWEHTEYKWVDPEEILQCDTVPGLYRAWERVR